MNGISRFAFGLSAVLALVPLCGCAARQMRNDFTGFESAYAETSNREVLLNLARLQNHDPTFFFKLGQISTSYRMQAGLTGFGNYVPQGNTPGASNVTGGGTPSLTYESNPAFTFIPVNDDTNAQLLLRPVPAETMYVLYQQGWRLDQLFRLMVDRIELTTNGPSENGSTECFTESIRNNPEDLGSYVRFLRISAVLYSLQKNGYLLLRGQDHFEPIYDKSLLPTPTVDPQKTAAVIAAKDFNDAWAKNSIWVPTTDGKDWQLGQKVFDPSFLLNPSFVPCGTRGASPAINPNDTLCPDLEKIENKIKEDPDIGHEFDNDTRFLPLVLSGLEAGFSIEGTADPSAKLRCQTLSDPSHQTGVLQIHLVLRSLLSLMAAAAQEEDAYDRIGSTVVPADPLLGKAAQEGLTFDQAVPRLERLPLLRLTWSGEHQQSTGPLIAPLTYRDKTYLIADEIDVSPSQNGTWNRDMFRLISALSAQVTVDISKFPLPEVLQLRTQ